MPRTGVFVCHCGTNIAGTVDVSTVVENAKKMPGVAYATDFKYMCSENGQKLIQEAVKEHNLDRVVVASCSPRMHEPTFRKAVSQVGHEPLPAGDGQHPRALLVGAPRQGHRHAQGHRHREHAGGQGRARRAAAAQARGPHQAGAGHRRRHRRHPGRAGHRQRRLRGGPGGAHRHHRRQDGHARQDLPHAGLLGLHPDAADGGRRPAQPHQADDLRRGRSR